MVVAVVIVVAAIPGPALSLYGRQDGNDASLLQGRRRRGRSNGVAPSHGCQETLQRLVASDKRGWDGDVAAERQLPPFFYRAHGYLVATPCAAACVVPCRPVPFLSGASEGDDRDSLTRRARPASGRERETDQTGA